MKDVEQSWYAQIAKSLGFVIEREGLLPTPEELLARIETKIRDTVAEVLRDEDDFAMRTFFQDDLGETREGVKLLAVGVKDGYFFASFESDEGDIELSCTKEQAIALGRWLHQKVEIDIAHYSKPDNYRAYGKLIHARPHSL